MNSVRSLARWSGDLLLPTPGLCSVLHVSVSSLYPVCVSTRLRSAGSAATKESTWDLTVSSAGGSSPTDSSSIYCTSSQEDRISLKLLQLSDSLFLLPDPSSTKSEKGWQKRLLTTTPKIGGPGRIVEVDEAKFGKRKYQRGRIVQGSWVLGGVEPRLGCTNAFIWAQISLYRLYLTVQVDFGIYRALIYMLGLGMCMS